MILITFFGPNPVLVVHGENVVESVRNVITCAFHFWIPAGHNMMVKNKLICPKNVGLRSQWNLAQMNIQHP